MHTPSWFINFCRLLLHFHIWGIWGRCALFFGFDYFVSLTKVLSSQMYSRNLHHRRSESETMLHFKFYFFLSDTWISLYYYLWYLRLTSEIHRTRLLRKHLQQIDLFWNKTINKSKWWTCFSVSWCFDVDVIAHQHFEK